MPDWNGDGKNDWHDDYEYHAFIKNDSSNQSRYSGGKSMKSTAIIMLIIVVAWELLKCIADMKY